MAWGGTRDNKFKYWRKPHWNSDIKADLKEMRKCIYSSWKRTAGKNASRYKMPETELVISEH